MKPLIICLACVAFAAANVALAGAVANTPLKPPKVYTPNGPPAKTQGKSSASSFAPRPGGTKQRVYGMPIQGKILKTQPKKPGAKPVSPLGR